MPVSASSSQAIDEVFASSIVPTLCRYIEIPNESALFDPEWRAHGHMDRAAELLAAWATEHLPSDASLEIVRLGERSPLIFIDVPAAGAETHDTVLLYGHFDKQPEMSGWRDGLGPWTPVLEGDKLYGRGGADDGYAIFASLTAINALRRDGISHARCVLLIEGCEESGSPDLPAYIEHLAARIGDVSLVVCLDSGCANYDQLWCTTSLRGLLLGDLEVSLLSEGVHSGDATGVVASSFRVARALLDRLEDCGTGELKLAALETPIPPQRRTQAERAAQVLGDEAWSKFPVHSGVLPTSRDPVELILNRTWRPGLAITGADGLPATASAGNVLRPSTRLRLSIRIPPRVDPESASRAVKQLLESNPPYGAKVTFHELSSNAGWDAPPLSTWLERALDDASRRYFGKPAMHMGEGGTIPFMHLLGQRFPRAEFCITGVLGPGSNAHGPNEFLHLPTARRLTLCIADVLEAHGKRAVTSDRVHLV